MRELDSSKKNVRSRRATSTQTEKAGNSRYEEAKNERGISGRTQPDRQIEHPGQHSPQLSSRVFDDNRRLAVRVASHRQIVVGCVVGEGEELREFVGRHHRGHQHHCEAEHPATRLHVFSTRANLPQVLLDDNLLAKNTFLRRRNEFLLREE